MSKYGSGARHRSHDERVARFDTGRGGRAKSIETRIGQRIQITPGGCWAFDGNLDEYGKVDNQLVHRVTYEALVGDVPDGWHLHHKCRNKGCANPQHLEALKPADHKAEHKQEQLKRHLAVKLRGIAS